MTAKVEDKRKITTTNEWTTARRLLFRISFLCFRSSHSAPRMRTAVGRPNPGKGQVSSVVLFRCFVFVFSNSMCIGGHKCVCAMGQRMGVHQARIDTLRCNLKCFLYHQSCILIQASCMWRIQRIRNLEFSRSTNGVTPSRYMIVVLQHPISSAEPVPWISLGVCQACMTSLFLSSELIFNLF